MYEHMKWVANILAASGSPLIGLEAWWNV